ncbi:hypothetical protein EIJ81_00410 (plasmid) [Aliivibrio salmonicida]|uniref:hypothetical protein n=1 Tax=Aliivibrio salmonicida TaxID=40269 RepID=UPI000F6C2FAC|nr:hypothetical protein [Aliivibrio salmonicida]AZL83362.1 hypothetical protein EIJ81_00410 [Aliivibrio salmonicida]
MRNKLNGKIMINEKKTITYNPFEPLFSVLSQKDSNGCNLEQRSNLMLRAVSISKDCVFWAPVGVTFVQSESCIYARKVVNKNVVINKKFFIDQDLKNSLTAFKKAVAKAVLDAVRSLQNAIFEYENCKCNHVNPSSNLRATLKVRLDKEKSINYIPRITVTINFSGSERVSKVVSRTLNKFHSRSFMKLVTQFVSYKNQCIDSGKVLPIKIPDIRVTNSDIELLAERSQSLFEHALTAYLSNVIEDTNEIRGKVIPAKDAFSIEYDHGLEKSYNFKKYFNDQNICLLVARICDFHMSHSAKNKTELDHYKLNKNSNCLDKIQRSSGLKGIIVALDRKGLSIVIHGIVGKHSNGSYKTKQKRVIDGKLKDAFNYAIDAHNEAFKLSSLSKTQYNVAYATLQLSILTKVPAPYLSSMDSCLEGVSSVVPIKCKMFNEHLPHFSLACKAVTTTPLKRLEFAVLMFKLTIRVHTLARLFQCPSSEVELTSHLV